MTRDFFILVCGFLLPLFSGDHLSSKMDETESVEFQQVMIRYPERVDLAFATPGRIKAIYIEEGQFVNAGELIAELENEREKAEYALRELKASSEEPLLAGRARVRSADLALENALGANKLVNAAIPHQEIRRLTLDSDLARAELDEKELEVRLAAYEAKIAKAVLESTQIRAPVSGIVTRKFLSAGSSVEGPRPVAQIVDKSHVRVEGYVTISEMRKLRPDQDIEIIRSSGEVLSARLVFVDLSAQQVQKLVRVWGVIKSAGEIIEGEAATARVTLLK